MTQQYIIHQGHPHLLLFLAGWAADATPFAQYRPQSMDYMVCYDYRTLTFDASPLGAYDEVHLVGWSMGVWAAAHLMAELGDALPPGERIAFNGTPLPIHEAYGIPPEVYRLTLDHLTPAALQKFMKRMCGSAECFRRFLSITPRRPFDEIRHELECIARQVPHIPVRPDFTRAYVSDRDVIIYTDHQLRYWQDRHVHVTSVEGAHYHEPTFRLLLEKDLPNSYEITYNKKTCSPMNQPQANPISKQLIAERFARARDTYSREAHVQREVAARMVALIEGTDAPARAEHIFEFGCGTGIYSRLLLEHFHPERLLLNDLCPEMEECVARLGSRPGQVSFTPGDAEAIALPSGVRLITSCSTLQWFAAPGRFFARCHAALQPSGVLAFSTFGGENLREIRRLTGHGLTYPSPARLRECLEPHFEVLHLSDEVVSLPLASPLHVLRHLRQTGVTGTGGGLWTPRRLQRFCDEYTRLYTDGRGEVSLTYHPIYVVARKKADPVIGL